MRMGHSFHWLEGQAPYFVNPKGKIVRLTVVGDIPYLNPGDKSNKPYGSKGKVEIPAAPAAAGSASSSKADASPNPAEEGEEALDPDGELADSEEEPLPADDLDRLRREASSPEHLRLHIPSNRY
jgi:hypothetical protein